MCIRDSDNFHDKNSHVIPGLMRRFHEAKLEDIDSVNVWGSGSPMREFLHVDDMASACVHIMDISKDDFNNIVNNPMCSHVNIGSGVDCKIKDLSELISNIVGFKGSIKFDCQMPDGSPRKLLNVDLLNKLGWSHSISLKQGLTSTYEWFKNNYDSIRNV